MEERDGNGGKGLTDGKNPLDNPKIPDGNKVSFADIPDNNGMPPNPAPNPGPNSGPNPAPNPTPNPAPNPAPNPVPNPGPNPAPNPTPIPTPTGSGYSRVNGAKAVGKKLIKPIWDYSHSKEYNKKRLTRNIAKGAARFGLGMAAAAVQAGISITDGKYNPMEALASYGAAGVAVNKIGGGIGSLHDTYVQGAISGDAEEQMKRAKERFGDREDVIEHNKRKYAGKEKEMMERERDDYFAYGITDLNEMDAGMKYANTLDSSLTQEQRDKAAVWALNSDKYITSIGAQKAITNMDERNKVIDAAVKDLPDGEEKNRKIAELNSRFEAVWALKEANKK